MTETDQTAARRRVHLHIGVHFAGTTRIVESLRQNSQGFAERGIRTPPARLYRQAMTGLLERLDGLPPIETEEIELLDDILQGNTAKAVIMADANWASPLAEALHSDRLYPDIGTRVAPIAELFESSDLRLSMALRNPAAFVQSAQDSGKARGATNAFLRNVQPETLRWCDTVDALRSALPNVPLTLWCEEDTPLIWPRVMRQIAGLPKDATLRGGFAALRDLIQPEGLKRLQVFLAGHPPETDAQYERTVLAFLDKYGKEDALDEPCDLPGWDANVIETVTQHYEDDIAALSARNDITFIAPASMAG
ncbi:hypothetical protein [Celeribacter baekdonensis]|uniref:hypothetical protein n=1 Tax=Celeribacter baekdonensis TaxID=875171 RepID=UPI0030DCA479